MTTTIRRLIPFLFFCIYMPLMIKPSLSFADTFLPSLNQELNEAYDIEVYGNHTMVPDNDFKETIDGFYTNGQMKGEYRYHGYDQNLNPYTNINFPNDLNSQKLLSEKLWLHKGWEHFNMHPPNYNLMAMNNQTHEEKHIRSWIRTSLPFKMTYGTEMDRLLATEEYLYIQTPPSSTHHGEGRLWHKTSNRIYYQTFSLPPLSLQIPEVSCSVEVLDKNNLDLSDGMKKLNVEVKVSGTLMDTLASLHYGTEDLEAFKLSLGSQTLTLPLKTAKSSYHIFKTEVTREMVLGTEKLFTGSAKAIFRDKKESPIATGFDTLSLNTTSSNLVSQFNIHSQTTDSLQNGFGYQNISIGDYDKVHLTLKKSGTVIDQHSFLKAQDQQINNWLKSSLKSEGIYSLEQEISKTLEKATHVKHFKIMGSDANIITPELRLPNFIFDNQSLTIIDKTDLTHCVEMTATLDEKYIDPSKSITFKPQSKNSLHHLVFTYTSNTGHISEYSSWIEILTTQPRIQGEIKGDFKEGASLFIENTSNSLNDSRLLETYPISYTYLVDEKPLDRSHGFIPTFGEHTLKIVGKNSLGRISEFKMPFYILKDLPPDIVFNVWNPVLTRNEPLDFILEANSVDGDLVDNIQLQVIHPQGKTVTVDKFTSFNQIGTYILKVIATENTGKETSIERIVHVENIRPTTQSITDKSIDHQSNLLIILDESLSDEDNNSILSSAPDIENRLKLEGLNITVDFVSLKEYSKVVYTETQKYYGDQNPADSFLYQSNGYEGILSLLDVSDMGKYIDYGHYDTKKTCITSFDNGDWDCTGISAFDCQDNSCSRLNMSFSAHLRCCGCKREIFINTICTSKRIWIPNVKWTTNYLASYGGNVTKNFKQMMPDRNLEENNYTMLISNSFILQRDIELTLGSLDYQIRPDDIDNTLQKIIESMKDDHSLKILINTPFDIHYIDYDRDGDSTKVFSHSKTFKAIFDNSNHTPSLDDQMYFNTPGLYTIKRQIIDDMGISSLKSNEDILKIYAHRKPIAILEMDWTYDYLNKVYKMNWIDASFDPDYQYSKANRGIKDTQVKIRKADDFFSYTLPSHLSSGTYEIYYTATDIDGAISDLVVYNLILPDMPPPIISADFIQEDPLSIGDPISIVNIQTNYYQNHTLTLSGPSLDQFVQIQEQLLPYTFWENQIYTVPKLADGMYQLTLVASDSQNKLSGSISHAFEVKTPINLKVKNTLTFTEGDTIHLSAESSKHVDRVEATIQLEDKTLTVELKKEKNIWIAELAGTFIEGNYSIFYEAFIDTHPIKTESKVQELTIKPLTISDLKISGSWRIWDGDEDLLGIPRSNMPHRFLALETVTISGISNTNNYQLIIDSCDAFKETANSNFNYTEAFKKTFPFGQHHLLGEQSFNITFPLPLAHSTLSIENKRLRDPYSMIITIRNGAFEKIYTLNNIEVTSNIYDFTYIQPK